MPDYLFFLSYARTDLNANLQRFFRDLSAEVTQLYEGQRTDPESPVGFFDREGVELGDAWDEKLKEAVHFSRVLVPLYTPRYFERFFCGKEFAAFHRPANAYSAEANAATKQPRRILPILWVPVAYAAPVQHLQAEDGDFPPEYLAHGLHHLMRLDTQNPYWLFVRAFARKLATEAANSHIPDGNDLHRLHELVAIPPIFPVNVRVHSATLPPRNSSSIRRAQFIFVAACAGEIPSIAGEPNPYGDDEGHWRPFIGRGENSPVYAMAQEAALRENLEYDRLPLDTSLRSTIDSAANAIVAVVDARSVNLEKYRNLLSCCDRVLNHLSIIVPWGAWDSLAEQEARRNLAATFPALTARRDRRSLATGITSGREMRRKLRKILAELIDMLLKEEIARRPATADPPPEVSNR